MPKLITAIASALLLAVLVTELFTRFFPNNYWVFFSVLSVALLIACSSHGCLSASGTFWKARTTRFNDAFRTIKYTSYKNGIKGRKLTSNEKVV